MALVAKKEEVLLGGCAFHCVHRLFQEVLFCHLMSSVLGLPSGKSKERGSTAGTFTRQTSPKTELLRMIHDDRGIEVRQYRSAFSGRDQRPIKGPFWLVGTPKRPTGHPYWRKGRADSFATFLQLSAKPPIAGGSIFQDLTQSTVLTQSTLEVVE